MAAEVGAREKNECLHQLSNPKHYAFGALWPNRPPLRLHVSMLKKLAGQDTPVTDNEAMAAVHLDANTYLRVHGTITYVDGFGHDHWTKFCASIRGGPLPLEHEASTPSKKCVQYNDADNND